MLPDCAVTRLKVRAARSDSVALRQAVSRQIGSSDLRLPGLSPSSILLVRRLSDPLPGRLSRHPSAWVADQRWQRALRVRLEQLKDRASRPHAGCVSEDAESLLFVDEAQLIACLACSLLDRAGSPPWWRQALAAFVPTASVHAVLGARVQLLPSVFSVLAAWGSEVRIANALSESEVEDLACRMAMAYGIVAWPPSFRAHAHARLPGGETQDPALVESIAEAVPATSAAGGPRPAGTARGDAPDQAKRHDEVAPWDDLWRPSAGAPRSPLEELLVGVALTLHRAPAVARSPTFEARVARWLQAATHTIRATARAPASAPNLVGGQLPALSDPQAAAAPDAYAVETTRDEEATPAPDAQTADLRAPGATREIEGPSSMPPALQAPSLAPATWNTRTRTEPRRVALEAHGSDQRPTADAATEIPLAPAEDPLAVDLREGGKSTELGGVLYLINLLVYLDLPRCFEATCGLASTVGAAGTLEALARALLPALPPDLADDPIWAVLARLDHRTPGEPPRAQALRSNELRLPVAWVEAMAAQSGALRWAREAGQLLVWCDSGTRLLDVPLRGAPERQVIAELSRYAAAGLNRPAQPALARECPASGLDHLRLLHWPDPLLRWLEFAAPAVRDRLARALGKAPGDAWDPLHEIARCPGRVHLTDTHLDMSANLQSISIPLRLAGLDRSPGWVAGLGRVVLFHFE